MCQTGFLIAAVSVLGRSQLPQSHNSRICCSETSKYHPDKNANDPKAADIFKEATFSYNILSDPDKRRQYDTAGFEAVESESQELELDLSNLGAVNIMFAALFSKLRVPIKTTVSATVLEEALNGVKNVTSMDTINLHDGEAKNSFCDEEFKEDHLMDQVSNL